MDYFYDGQIRRYITQFMRIFIGFKYQSGDGELKHVPVLYGDMTRQVAAIIRENSENKLISVPKISCYITGLEMDMTRLSDATFVSKVHIRERAYTETNNVREYQNNQGSNYTVERLMPTPFTLRVKADIWTSNTDQKLQLLEQILVLFNPSLEVQTTDNYVDWTSLSVINLTGQNFSSRSIPVGTDSDIDVCSLDFDIPIWITPPAKVKKLGIVQAVVSNIFSETGDILNLENLVFNNNKPAAQLKSSTIDDYEILLLKSNNGQPLDYNVTITDLLQAGQSLNIAEELASGAQFDWNTVLELKGGYKPGSQIYFVQPSGYELVGTFVINPLDPAVLVVTFDEGTIPTNTIISSVDQQNRRLSGASAGTIDAIIDPYKFNPLESANGRILGVRYLMLDDVNNSQSVGDSFYDGPDAWKNLDGSDPVIEANSIIEWNGNSWINLTTGWKISSSPFDDTVVYTTGQIIKSESKVYKVLQSVTKKNNSIDIDKNTDFFQEITLYVQNLRTGIQYRWDGTQWLKSFEGEYSSGYWGLNLNPV